MGTVERDNIGQYVKVGNILGYQDFGDKEPIELLVVSIAKKPNGYYTVSTQSLLNPNIVVVNPDLDLVVYVKNYETYRVEHTTDTNSPSPTEGGERRQSKHHGSDGKRTRRSKRGSNLAQDK